MYLNIAFIVLNTVVSQGRLHRLYILNTQTEMAELNVTRVRLIRGKTKF
jgi:hypothetical protein